MEKTTEKVGDEHRKVSSKNKDKCMYIVLQTLGQIFILCYFYRRVFYGNKKETDIKTK